jgi:hypothetical protein
MARRLLEFTFNGTDVKVTRVLDEKAALLMDKLVERLTLSMTKIQAKARAKAPHGETGALEESISNPRAHAEGKTIVGELDWGGGDASPYARAMEEGGLKEYAVNPKEGVGAYRGGFAFGKYRPAHPAVKAKEVLRWYSADGGKVFAAYAFRKPLRARHFMRDSLDESREEINRGIRETLSGVLNA